MTMTGLVSCSYAVLALLAAAGTTSTTAATAAKPRNVLFLVADDLRPEISAFTPGAEAKTPNLDKLAAESMVLQHNYVQQAVCGPTRASFLVSRRPGTLRTVTHTKPTYWRERAGPFWTIPQLFRESGWHTTSFGKVFDLRTSSYNLTAEWICDGPYSWSEPPVYCDASLWAADGRMSKGQSHMVLSAAQEAKVSDNQIVDAALARLNRTMPSPWFLGIGLHRPHLPLIVPQRMLDLYQGPGSVRLPLREAPKGMPVAASDCAGGKVCYANHSSMELWEQYSFNATTPKKWDGWDGALHDPMPEAWAAELKLFYLAAVSHTDEMIGRALQAVADRGETDSTVVVLVGDHGWHVGDQGMWAKCTAFEAATRAPFLIRVPGVTDGGRSISALTEHVDIMPTLAAAALLPPVPTCPPDSRSVALCTEGVNLLPLAADPALVLRKASFSQWPHPFDSQTPASMGFSIRTPDWRYTEWVLMSYTANGTHVPRWGHRCARELYNLTAAAPGTASEAVNLAEAPAAAARVATMAQWLRAGWRAARSAAPWPAPTPSPPPTVLPACPTKG